MARLMPRLRSIGGAALFLTCLALLVLSSRSSSSSQAAHTFQGPQATPTCPPHGCSRAWTPRYYGFQPPRDDLRPIVNAAARNELGANGPPYEWINHGIPPVQEPVTAARPIPPILLRGAAWQESHWLQFADAVTDPDNRYACTLIGHDPSGTCGFGMMQITTCMNTPLPPDCSWVDQTRVSRELIYNLGTGTNFFIKKWNVVPYVGDNDHTVTAQWYYAILAYNSWGSVNNPNSSSFHPQRPPYLEGNYSIYSYPYPERVWGWMAHPERAGPAPTPVGWHWLWRPSNIAAIPRGIFPDSNSWPPPDTTLPLVHLLPDIRVMNGIGPSIILRNTTNQTLAVDVMFYNANHTFNRRWLDPSPDPPYYLYPYIRLAPYSSRTLSVAVAFPGVSFTGYACVNASEGIEITLQLPPSSHKVYLPLTLKNAGDNCYNEVWNGGFEDFLDGKPRYWTVSSADAYPLADSTWFQSGHYGAYLGGYDDLTFSSMDDSLKQYFYIPPTARSADLSYAWYVRSEESPSATIPYDQLHIRLRDAASGNLVAELAMLSNLSPRDTWGTAYFDLLAYRGRGLHLSLEADADISKPTSFFIDNLSLWICRSGVAGPMPTETPTPSN